MNKTISYLKSNKYTVILKALVKAIISSCAINTILIVAPTIQIKFALSLFVILKNICDLNKIVKTNNIEKKNFVANELLHNLETTKENNKTINTRFDEDLIKYINEFLKRNNQNVPKTYLELRNAIYNLDIDKKISLINLLNNLTGNKYNTKELFDNTTLYKETKNSILKPILIGASIGTGIATSINSIDPSIMASIYNSTGIGIFFSRLTKNSTFSIIGMVLGIVLTKALQFIPVIGTSLIAKENIIITSIIASTLYLTFNSIKKVFHSIKSYIQRKKFINDYKNDLKIDSMLYAKDNFDEFIEEPNLTYITNYLKENNFNLDASSITELKSSINNLSFIDKIKVNNLLSNLEYKNMNFKQKILKYIKDFFSFLYYTLVLVLGTLTIIDVFVDNSFLDSLRLQIFPNSYKKYDLIKDVPIEKVIESPTPIPTSKPTLDVPKPMPGPAPDAYVPKVEENLIKNDFINNPNFIDELCSKDGKNIFDTLNSLEEYRFISHSVKNMNLESICKLTDYVNSTNSIDRTTLNYLFIRDNVNDRLKEINKYVQSIMDKTKITSSILSTSNFVINSKKKTLKK